MQQVTPSVPQKLRDDGHHCGVAELRWSEENDRRGVRTELAEILQSPLLSSKRRHHTIA